MNIAPFDYIAEVTACRKLPCALGTYCFSTAMWISIYFFSVGTLHTILTYSYTFVLYLIAAFHPSPIFANDERLQDPELASKTRFPYYRYRSVSVSELIRRSGIFSFSLPKFFRT